MQGNQAFNDLRDEWYDRIKSEGFEDIEDTSNPDGPLKEWHSFKFVSMRAQTRKVSRSGYQDQIDSFANAPEFPEIVKLIVKHGNSRFTEAQVEQIWTLHRNGWSERKIGKEVDRSNVSIHFLLRRIRQWMRLAS